MLLLPLPPSGLYISAAQPALVALLSLLLYAPRLYSAAANDGSFWKHQQPTLTAAATATLQAAIQNGRCPETLAPAFLLPLAAAAAAAAVAAAAATSASTAASAVPSQG